MKSIERYKEGRICHHTDCRMRLSIYNSTEYCTIHQSEALEAEEYFLNMRQGIKKRVRNFTKI